MNWRKMLFPILFFLSMTVIAQVPSPTPTPNPNSRQRQVNPIIADNANFDRLRSLELMIPKDSADNHPLLNSKKGIYRRPSKEEIQILAVAEPLLTLHAALLRGPNTGIVKLNGESSCLSDVDVVVATEKCLGFKMPGAGTAYSFRTESYRLPRLADVILLDGVFRTGGVFQQVFMADIGDVAIEDVSLETRGLKYLNRLKPVRDSDEFMRFDAEIANGIEADGLTYRKGQLVKDNSTFVLRSIAYRGSYIRSIDGISYDELEFDKRRDVIVAFRVVDMDTAGNITILWKRLKDTESPKLKIMK
ncbi:MAG: hypothetical protein ABIV48_03715 [Pyrinomonadaceae bacterium]